MEPGNYSIGIIVVEHTDRASRFGVRSIEYALARPKVVLGGRQSGGECDGVSAH